MVYLAAFRASQTPDRQYCPVAGAVGQTAVPDANDGEPFSAYRTHALLFAVYVNPSLFVLLFSILYYDNQIPSSPYVGIISGYHWARNTVGFYAS
jgi:hypothetical protein